MAPVEVFTASLVPLPGQPDGVEWPTRSWPRGRPVRPVAVILGRLLDEAMDGAGPLAQTHAVVVIHRGRLVGERYGGVGARHGGTAKVGPDTKLPSWSMAKSMLHGAVGILVGEGRLHLGDPAPVPAWDDPGDPRHAITIEHLLEMRDGLEFAEDYVDANVSDVMEMLWGDGRDDVAGYAARRPAAAPAGSRFNYSSGSSNIVSGLVAGVVGRGGSYRRFLLDRMLRPIGATSAEPGFDASGTWVASSTLYATARDFARFGLLYLRDGVWESRRILPPRWVDHGRRPRSVDPTDGMIHGAHWWVVGDEHGSFWASGFGGQSLLVCPGLDLVVVRMGETPAERAGELRRWNAEVVTAFAAAAGA